MSEPAVGTKEAALAQLEERQTPVTQARQRHRELEMQAEATGLTLDETDELVRLERWIPLEERHLERLRLQMERAHITFDLDAGKAHHDGYIPEKMQWFEKFAAWLGAGYDLMDEFVRIDGVQKEPLLKLTPPQGGTPFAQISPAETLQNVLSRAPHAAALLEVLMGSRLTHGHLELMRDVDPGCREISERAMQRFLEGVRA